MVRLLILQTITFRIIVILADYLVLAVVLQRPFEAGFVTLVRHVVHTLMYWGHEVAWAHRKIDTVLDDKKALRHHAIQKAISFRIISFVADIFLLLLLTGDAWFSGVGAVLIGITNTVFFYYHDRWWEAWRARHSGPRK